MEVDEDYISDARLITDSIFLAAASSFIIGKLIWSPVCWHTEV